MTKDDNYKSGNQWVKRTSGEQLTCLVDEASSTVTYIGSAAPGSATTSAVWRIKKVLVDGTVTSIKFADSDELFNNIWDNRASLTY